MFTEVVTESEPYSNFPPVNQPITGRHSSFNPIVATRICDLIGDGMGLKEACRSEGIPSITTVFNWIAKGERGEEPFKSFLVQYMRARETQGEFHADQIVSLADEEPRMVYNKGGAMTIDPGWVSNQRNRIEARKWVAAKLRPKIYGDKITVDGMTTHVTNNTLAVTMTGEQIRAELAKLAQKNQLPDGIKMLENGKVEIDADYITKEGV